MTQDLKEKITQLCETIESKNKKLSDLDNRLENMNMRMSTVLENIEKNQTETKNLTLLMEEMLYSLSTTKSFTETDIATENTSKKQVEKLVKLN